MLAEKLAPVLEALGDKLAETSEAPPAPPPPPPPAFDEKAVESVTKHLGALAEGLGGIHSSLAEVARRPQPTMSTGPTVTPSPSLGGAREKEVQELLQRVDKTLTTLQKAQQGAERGRRLSGAVHDLLTRHVDDVETKLLPLLQGLERKLADSTSAGDRKVRDQVDKALRSFDLVLELTDAFATGRRQGRGHSQEEGRGEEEAGPVALRYPPPARELELMRDRPGRC